MRLRTPVVPLTVSLLLAAGCAGQATDKPAKEASEPSQAEDAGAQPEAEEDDSEEQAQPKAEEGAALSVTMPAFENQTGDDDAHEMAANEVSGIGFRVTGLSKQGWSRSTASGGELMLSGPPGGPLGFEVRRYASDQRGAVIEELFTAWTGQAPDAKSEVVQVELGGAKRGAQAFRTGQSLATSATCIVDVPAPSADKGGLWVRFYVGAAEGETPSCEAAMKVPVFVPIVDSFKTVE